MPRQSAPIPFMDALQGGLEELGGASPAAMNVIMRGSTLQRRPGIGVYAGAYPVVGSGPVGAILVTQSGAIYVVSGASPNRRVYKVTATGAVSLSELSETDLRGTSRPYIVETESILALTGGDRVQKLVLSSNAVSPLANAPMGKRVIFHGYRLLIDDPTTKTLLDYSALSSGPTDYSGFETWGTGVGTAGFIQSNAKASTIQAHAENSNEVFIWTTRGLQVFAPDATNDYAPSASQEYGCIAPDSVVKTDQEFAWLDHLRRFVISDGRTTAQISSGIQKILNDMAVVTDCFGYRYVEGDTDLLIWSFPTDGRTLVYQKGAGWSEWTLWNAVENNWAPWSAGITSHHAAFGTNLLGGAAGSLVELTLRNRSDSGVPIHASATTGFQNRGSENRKTCHGVQLTLRRGQTTSGEEPYGLLSWRDDLGPWNTPIQVSLGASGDTEPVVQFYGLGVYRRRQWRFTFEGTEDFQLVAASETFSVQGN
jgi:hypothetical protein